ncbi:MAG TPA: ABC transporter ATP-binding protein [Thermoanaerobaculaceae bacterium]|nr:ABC transporter ATP-binding protein [Thermoanaerobaculaceae bacterium]HPS76969.1 ABC transporter ATP-binding protein [Thermoanaerobaculaceae bacterium]
MIRTEALCKRFGDKLAVAELDLAIPAGEFFCFLGPNGAGKTTTIKILTGLLRPTSGRALVGGHDVMREPEVAKRLLGYVPDQPFLYDRLTGRELLRLVAGLYDLPSATLPARIDAVLADFEMNGLADQLIGDLSHGMRQKLSFAATFLHEPRVVVVDEPWVGLDPRSIHRVKTTLKERTRQGLTVFMSTHTLSIAEEVADRIGIIHQGRLLALGSVAEIKGLVTRPGSLEDVFLELTREEE